MTEPVDLDAALARAREAVDTAVLMHYRTLYLKNPPHRCGVGPTDCPQYFTALDRYERLAKAMGKREAVHAFWKPVEGFALMRAVEEYERAKAEAEAVAREVLASRRNS